MIPLIKEVVLKYNWLSEPEFYDFIGVCESTPGPVAINMATYIGSMQGGIFGSILATLGVVLPSFIIILLIASIIKNFTNNKYFKGFIKGTKPVVSALIISTGAILLIKALGLASLKNISFDLISFVILGLLLAVYFVVLKAFHKKLSSIQLIIISAVIGIAVSLIFEKI
jgi:chromate transporter